MRGMVIWASHDRQDALVACSDGKELARISPQTLRSATEDFSPGVAVEVKLAQDSTVRKCQSVRKIRSMGEGDPSQALARMFSRATRLDAEDHSAAAPTLRLVRSD